MIGITSTLLRHGRSKPVGSITRAVPSSLWYRPIRAWIALRRRLQPERWTDADPMALRWIDPCRTVYDGLPETASRPPWGRVESGSWDQIEARFEERAVARAIEQRFQKGIPWEETDLKSHFLEQIERRGDAWGYRDLDRFRDRVHEIDALYRHIRDHGYLTQEELRVRRVPHVPGPSPVPRLAEINVDIGRDGRILWRGYGQHRLAIARVLGIDRIPILVVRRHREWHEVRSRIRDGTPPPESLQTHPDLIDLVADRF